MKRLMAAFVLTVLVPLTAQAETGIKSFEHLLEIFHKAGFPTVMEVPQGGVYIHQTGVHTEKNKGTRVDVYASKHGAERLPVLDFYGENISLLSKLFPEYYRAYKVDESFLCYVYEGQAYAMKGSVFARCLIFPIPIDQVVRAVSPVVAPPVPAAVVPANMPRNPPR